jgi:hypothetical protein
MNKTHSLHQELERIQFVASHYNEILGLRALPLAVALLAIPVVTGSLVTGIAYTVVVSTLPLVLVGAVVLGVRANRSYRRRFGRVEPRRKPWTQRALLLMGALLVLGAALTPQILGWEEALPFSPSWGIFWAWVLTYSLLKLRFVPHYTVLACVGLVLALAPLGMLEGLSGHPFSTDDWGLFTMGGLMLILAWLDHRFLTRTLGSATPASGDTEFDGVPGE